MSENTVAESIRSFYSELDPIPFAVGALVTFAFLAYTAVDTDGVPTTATDNSNAPPTPTAPAASDPARPAAEDD